MSDPSERQRTKPILSPSAFRAVAFLSSIAVALFTMSMAMPKG
jgi:hypothetical protein